MFRTSIVSTSKVVGRRTAETFGGKVVAPVDKATSVNVF